MTVIEKDGVKISMPAMSKETKLNMERCAEFMARMIQKYGKDVMAEINAKEEDHTAQNEC